MKTQKFLFNACLGLSAALMFSQCSKDPVSDDGDGGGDPKEDIEITSEDNPWVVLDMESESADFKLTAKNTDKLEFVANPDNSGINTSSKSLKWMKAKSGNLYVDVLDIETYYDLSKWKSIKFDVRTSGSAITQCKAVLYKSDMDNENRVDKQLASYEITDADIATNTWGSLYISLDKLTFVSGVTKDDLKKVNYIKLMINPTEDSEVALYIDNFTFTNEEAPSTGDGDGSGESGNDVQDPGGTEWVLVDNDTEGASPWLGEEAIEGEFLRFAPNDGPVTNYGIVDDPTGSGKGKIVKWDVRCSWWGSMGVELAEAGKSFELSKWNKICVQVYVKDKALRQFKVAFYNGLSSDGENNKEVADYETWDGGAANTWHSFEIPLNSVNLKAGFTTDDLKTIKNFKIFVNGGLPEGQTDGENGYYETIYMDNLKLTRLQAPANN